MIGTRWRKACMAAAMASGLASSTVWAQTPAKDPAPVVVIREPGKPEHRCVIEATHPQPNGHVIYDVRDLATGERMRVVDNRTNKTSGPFVSPAASKIAGPSDAGMASALSGTPFASGSEAKRAPTLAEQAPGARKGSVALTGMFRSAETPKPAASPVQAQINLLKAAASPAQREMAAMTLTISDACTSPAVVQALTSAARSDAEASVRGCCVLCLYRLSSVIPEAVPVIEALTEDASSDVSSLARKAMEEINRRREIDKN